MLEFTVEELDNGKRQIMNQFESLDVNEVGVCMVCEKALGSE
jgi:hypothetical protein